MTYNAKYTIEEKIQMVTEQKNSGLVAKTWCGKNNIAYGSFKNFSQDIKRDNESNNVQLGKNTRDKVTNPVSWISSPVVPPSEAERKELIPPETDHLNVHYMIEIGLFKIHVPETIKAESLKTLVEVLSLCS